MSASDTNLGTPGPQETDETAQPVQQESGSEIVPPEDKGDQPAQRTNRKKTQDKASDTKNWHIKGFIANI